MKKGDLSRQINSLHYLNLLTRVKTKVGTSGYNCRAFSWIFTVQLFYFRLTERDRRGHFRVTPTFYLKTQYSVKPCNRIIILFLSKSYSFLEETFCPCPRFESGSYLKRENGLACNSLYQNVFGVSTGLGSNKGNETQYPHYCIFHVQTPGRPIEAVGHIITRHPAAAACHMSPLCGYFGNIVFNSQVNL